MKFVLRPEMPQVRDNALQAIRDLDPDREWSIEIKRHVRSKTAEQRSWFHAAVQIFADEVGMRPGDIKEICKSRLFGWRTVKYGGIELVIADGHSEKLNREEYSQLIEIVYQLAAESGVILPQADRFRRAG